MEWCLVNRNHFFFHPSLGNLNWVTFVCVSSKSLFVQNDWTMSKLIELVDRTAHSGHSHTHTHVRVCICDHKINVTIKIKEKIAIKFERNHVRFSLMMIWEAGTNINIHTPSHHIIHIYVLYVCMYVRFAHTESAVTRVHNQPVSLPGLSRMKN